MSRNIYKKILLLGGAGFIGSSTAQKLYEMGLEILVVDNLSTGRIENLDKRINFVQLDIGNYAQMQKIFKTFKPDLVFNFAFNVLVPESIKNPSLEIKSIKDHLMILELCKLFNVKKNVFPSTGFVYGNLNKKTAIKESQQTSLENPYSIAKFTAEKFTVFYSKKFNLDYTIFRYAAIYGPGQITGAMSDYIRCAKKNINCHFWGTNKSRDYVFITDTVNANILSFNQKSSQKIINIGTGKGTNLLILYKKICKILNVKEKIFINDVIIGEQDNYKLDNTYAKKVLGWEPTIDLNKGLSQTISYHLKNNL